jgi:hypothetical protein
MGCCGSKGKLPNDDNFSPIEPAQQPSKKEEEDDGTSLLTLTLAPNESGRFGVILMALQDDDGSGSVRIREIESSSPNAVLFCKGDEIISVGGVDVRGDYEKCMEQLRKSKGNSVEVCLRRNKGNAASAIVSAPPAAAAAGAAQETEEGDERDTGEEATQVAEPEVADAASRAAAAEEAIAAPATEPAAPEVATVESAPEVATVESAPEVVQERLPPPSLSADGSGAALSSAPSGMPDVSFDEEDDVARLVRDFKSESAADDARAKVADGLGLDGYAGSNGGDPLGLDGYAGSNGGDPRRVIHCGYLTKAPVKGVGRKRRRWMILRATLIEWHEDEAHASGEPKGKMDFTPAATKIVSAPEKDGLTIHNGDEKLLLSGERVDLATWAEKLQATVDRLKATASSGGGGSNSGGQGGAKEKTRERRRSSSSRFKSGPRRDRREARRDMAFMEDMRAEPARGRYEGERNKKGEKHGHGKYTTARGDVYEGQWAESYMHGKGKCTWVEGDVYEGGYKAGKKHGTGSVRYADGDMYEGEFRAGAMEGQGMFTYIIAGVEPDPDAPEGSAARMGVEQIEDVYEGSFAGGRPDGHGLYRYADGGVYEGEYRGGKKEGRGTARYIDGAVYTGDYKGDKMHGRGKYTYPSGAVYEGQWKGDEENGHGVARYADGNTYDGQWVRGRREGVGTFRWKDAGNVEVSRFVGGKNAGEGAKWSVDGESAYRLKDGQETGETISLEEAKRIADEIGLPAPF